MDTGRELKEDICEFYPDIEKFKKITEGNKKTLIPVYKKIRDTILSPTETYESLRESYGFLLESMQGDEKIARFSIIGTGKLVNLTADPYVKISGNRDYFRDLPEINGSDPLDALSLLIKKMNFNLPDLFGFSGGLAGYISYDYALRANEKLKGSQEKSDFPLAEFMMPENCVIFDHEEKSTTILTFIMATEKSDNECSYKDAVSRIRKTENKIFLKTSVSDESGTKTKHDFTNSQVGLKCNLSRESFEEMVQKTKEHIFDGDIFQTVISRQFECPFTGDPLNIYKALRIINPSPYMYYLEFGKRKIVGASPEMLVKTEGRNVTTVPIAGTRKRGDTPKEDALLKKDLLDDKKERAEHIMLVDLARNDLGRVSGFGSVKVTDFMQVEKFSHVQHIVSTITGTLDENSDSFDAFRSCFPAGTVSGAPKLRAMQIINELENSKRGLYAGAVGYAGFNGNIDFAIAIRTVVVENNKAVFQSGAGIVADSVPENEYLETESKAAGILSAIISAGDFS
ncbi:anthranilate synthase component I [Methanoplanus sp. FWC-SCC4]|uniref:Anthranilate synthase component 1 n=1 Tax=Methanochimaera problematica TaxID=2609417 RepID=A0AA97FE86_9EURY|nr:anthranilate synthase component I [Methanoplanus sp. FWC-SCC4]WOF16433.1 anthranilate synthase component I [Methanoplanus sp. FWC-SCC4]